MRISKNLNIHRRLWWQAHLYIGLTLGAMFAVIGLTGSLIVFWQPLDALLNADLFKTSVVCAETRYRPIDNIINSALTHAPAKGKLRSLSFPNPERPVFTATYEVANPGADWDDRFLVYVEPCNGLVTGSRFYDSQLKPLGGPLMGIIIRMHTSLLLNFPGFWLGNHVLSFGSALLMVSVVIGAYLWWPRNGKWLAALTFKRNASGARLNYDLHKVFGIASGSLLLMSLFTGIHMYNPWTDWIDQGVNYLSPVTRLASAPIISQTIPGQRIISAEQAVHVAQNSVPNGQPIAISFPEDDQGVYSISLKTVAIWDSEINIDQYNGKVIQLFTPTTATVGDHFLGWLFPLHTGQALGLPGRILILLLGLVPAVLYVTGFIRWHQKRKSSCLHKSKQLAN